MGESPELSLATSESEPIRGCECIYPVRWVGYKVFGLMRDVDVCIESSAHH